VRRFICFFFLVLLASCAAFLDHPESIRYQPNRVILLGSEVSTVVLSAKSSFIVQVSSNPSTGYRWVLNIPPKVSNCFVVSKDGEFSKDPGTKQGLVLMGAPGLQEWEIQANCVGNFVLQWHNLRPWEKEKLPINTYPLRLEITPS